MIVHVEKTTYELPYIILPKVQVYSLNFKTKFLHQYKDQRLCR